MNKRSPSESEKKIWFPAKTYGFGWGTPTCWQGWAVLAVYLGLICAGTVFLGKVGSPDLFIAYIALLSGALVFVCWLKGEKPGWRWKK